MRCKKIVLGAPGEIAAPAPVLLSNSLSPKSLEESKYPKFITTYEEALEVAEDVLEEIGENRQPEELGGLDILPPEVAGGPWAINKDAAKRTLYYIFNTIYHTCYMLAIVNGKKHLMKLEPEGDEDQLIPGVPDFYGAMIQETLDTSDDKRWKRFRGKDLRVMQCVLKTRRDERTFSTQYDEWLQSINLPLPDGLFILNLTDAVILRKDGNLPWEAAGEPIQLPKFLPILGGSGSELCWDIPIPNYDDVMIILGKQKVDTFETDWSKKITKAVFRGGFTGCGTTSKTNMRLALGEMPPSDLFDVKLVGEPSKNPRFDPIKGLSFVDFKGEPTTTKMSKEQQSRHKYILHVDGNVAAYRLLEFMKMGSVIIKVQGGYRLWFEHLLENMDNMLLVDPKVKKVQEAVRWCVDHDAKCKQIAAKCKALGDQLLNKDFIDATFAKTLWALVPRGTSLAAASRGPMTPPNTPPPLAGAVARTGPMTPPAPVASEAVKTVEAPKKKLTAKELFAQLAAKKAAGQQGGKRTRKLRRRCGRTTRKY